MPVSLREDDDDYDDGDWAASDVVILIRVFYSVSLQTVQVTDTFDGYDTDKVMTTTRDNDVRGGVRKARAALPSRDDDQRDRAAMASHGMAVASGNIWKVRSCV
jgi:hypothetical protein